MSELTLTRLPGRGEFVSLVETLNRSRAVAKGSTETEKKLHRGPLAPSHFLLLLDSRSHLSRHD